MVVIAGIMEGIASRKDRTVKISIGTNELSPDEAAQLFSLSSQFCYIGIKAEPFVKEERNLIDNLKADFENAKTPGQRLRGILFRLWEKNGEGYKDFQSYYLAKMDQLCDHYKGKLDAESY